MSLETDKDKKVFVRGIVRFLREQMNSRDVNADSVESLEVAVQCLEAVFDIEQQQSEESVAKSQAKEPIDLYAFYRSVYVEESAERKEQAEVVKDDGNRLMREGKYLEALQRYNKALTLDVTNPILYCNRAAAYIRLNEFEQAIPECKMAISYKPDYSKAYARLGIAYSHLKRMDEAISAYTKALELDPENSDLRHNFSVLQQQRTTPPAGAAQPANAAGPGIPINLLQNFSEANVSHAMQMLANPNNTEFGDLLREIMNSQTVQNILQQSLQNSDGLLERTQQIVDRNPDFVRNFGNRGGPPGSGSGVTFGDLLQGLYGGNAPQREGAVPADAPAAAAATAALGNSVSAAESTGTHGANSGQSDLGTKNDGDRKNSDSMHPRNE